MTPQTSSAQVAHAAWARRPRLPARRAALMAASLIIAPAASLASGVAAPAARPDGVSPGAWPRAASPAAMSSATTEQFITELMARMTLEEKVGQTINADIGSITPEDLRHYRLGALLAGGDSWPGGQRGAAVPAWQRQIAAFQHAAMTGVVGHAAIPLLFGIDAVHGNNHIPGATIFPHNIGLGAARDPALIERIGQATAAEVAATGANWTFGPTLAVPRDVRWGRSYEGFSEDPDIVRTYAGAMTLGLQGALRAGAPIAPGRVVAAAKHFLGDGATEGGHDQGDARISEAELIRLHAQGYPAAIDAGVLSVMVSFSSWNGQRDIVNRGLLTDVLKGRMGFAGFTVGDWNAQGEVPGCTTTSCPQAINAGLDMLMAPDSWKGLFHNTLAQVRAGGIAMARLDDAVRRILRVKVKAGLFDGRAMPQGDGAMLGSPAHRAIARQAVRESLVLLKNNGVLPIAATAHVLVAGEGADSIARQCGGWTLSWQGTGNSNADFPHGESIFAALQASLRRSGGSAELSPTGSFARRPGRAMPDLAVVVFGEEPYAEFQGDITTLEYQPGDKRGLALLRRLRALHIPVVSVFLSGRPLWTNPEINASDAFVAAWLPGTEAAGIADLLLAAPPGRKQPDFTGQLSFSWPRTPAPPPHREDAGYAPQFPLGYGLSYAHPGVVGTLPEQGAALAAPPSAERYFDNGRPAPSWTLSATGAVTLTPLDAGAQENARRAQWSGPGAVAITGGPVDLSRQSTGDMTLTVDYHAPAAPRGPVELALQCGPGCGAALDATALLTATPGQTWRSAHVRLSCFAREGAHMQNVTAPFVLRAAAPYALTFRRVLLEPDTTGQVCPPEAKPQ